MMFFKEALLIKLMVLSILQRLRFRYWYSLIMLFTQMVSNNLRSEIRVLTGIDCPTMITLQIIEAVTGTRNLTALLRRKIKLRIYLRIVDGIVVAKVASIMSSRSCFSSLKVNQKKI